MWTPISSPVNVWRVFLKIPLINYLFVKGKESILIIGELFCKIYILSIRECGQPNRLKSWGWE